MADRRRRYLEIQRELGGNEVILSRPLQSLLESRIAPAPSQAEEPPDPQPEPDPSAPPSALPPREPASKPARHWSVDAPPIPTAPGIVIAAPPAGRLGAAGWRTLEEVAQAVAGCQSCFLCQGRTRTVPGEGNPSARLMFIGEGPGQTEDETGRPFVGRAGELLTRMIEAIDLRREEVYIANVVKCRPPQNRKPLPEEMAACAGYLERQIELVGPAALVALGATAAEAMLQARQSLGQLRGRVHSYRGIPLVVTYHPAALLRNPNWKKPAWDDVRIARQLLDR